MMTALASRGRQPHPFDVLLLLASFAVVGWIVFAH
jgi:hypothetical protein